MLLPFLLQGRESYMAKDGNFATQHSKTHSERVPLAGDLLRVCFNLVDVVSGSGFQILFCLVHHLCKDIRVPNGQIGEHLAVDLNAAQLQSVD